MLTEPLTEPRGWLWGAFPPEDTACARSPRPRGSWSNATLGTKPPWDGGAPQSVSSPPKGRVGWGPAELPAMGEGHESTGGCWPCLT